ncbi:cytochrome P450 [Catellatospora sp. IY07-71]|uniref:cytochrome P450 n=1 Tax=Catellatospora sp. IY07-71 TaxID=2728827 RepID=UPI001BB309CA|nr:cytochrome P450 [Catellatospora sp. IY07-71]BCJ75415.1 cytochrome P450 [Catellatospora sp. IY07-71]
MSQPEQCVRPPGPRGHWLLGNTPAYDADRMGFLRRTHAAYGDVFSFDERTVFVTDPELTHDALARTNTSFLTELAPFAPRPDLTQAAAQADAWMSARRTVWAGLNHSAAAAADARTVELLDEHLRTAAERETDVVDLMRSFAAHTIAEYCFGPDSAGIPALLADNLAITEPFTGSSYQFPAWLPLPRHRRFFRVHRDTVETLTGIVRRRRASGGGGRDLLGFLLGADPAMPDRTVTATLRGILMGGHGIPAAAYASIVKELATRPQLAADLRDEAGHGVPAARLPLAEAVVKEVLRLQPPVWLMTRTASAATTLGGWSLAPGDEVLLNPYLIQRDPRWWARPDEFDPGRWLSGQAAPRAAYLPFGAGPRVCVGSALTMRQLTLATSRLAQAYTVESGNAATAAPRFHGRLAPAGMRARFRPAHR